MNQKVIIESLAMDLKRVALGLHRGSNIMANRFKQEALERAEELESASPSEYLQRLIMETRKRLQGTEDRIAEDSLMLSILFQNFALKNL